MNASDIEIAQQAHMENIFDIAARAGIPEQAVEPYGRYKAKIDIRKISKNTQHGKLILVTAINPTPAGEGKTTTSVGLADALSSVGKKTMLCLREPSLGPVFGVKGGAAGGGFAQVVPMEDINLHFTGDFHAITSANNLLAAMIDNHIKQSNELNIYPRRIVWKRALDMNDRQLRHIVDGLGGPAHGIPREDGFDITVASEVMAIFCLADDIADLKNRLARMIVAYTYDNKPVTAGQLHAHGAMAALLKDAIQPNLVQTLEHTPAFVHGGPFANIAHGCNSTIATTAALSLADYVVTEAGFGADLGAEKFCDITCRSANISPDAIVIVATVRALKMHGGVAKDALSVRNDTALKAGLSNLEQHIANIKEVFGIVPVVAINAFPTDDAEEFDLIKQACRAYGVEAILSEVWEKGSAGGVALAQAVVQACDETNNFSFAYDLEASIEAKLNMLAQRIYHADGVDITPAAQKQIQQLSELGYGNLPICMAKTQYSFSDNQALLGAPRNFRITVKNLKVSAGAGFVVAYAGDIMTMPGLPKEPAAERIDVDDLGKITGLF